MSGDRPVIAPAHVRSNAFPASEELRMLGRVCIEYGVSDKSKLVLARLASLPPVIRLIVNLKALLNRMADGPIHNVLTEGLSPQEHGVLVELDVRGLPTQAREVAHGLMNVHERWAMMKPLRGFFRKASKTSDGFLLPKAEMEELIDQAYTPNP